MTIVLGQSFEGTIDLRIVNEYGDNTTTLSVKGVKTSLLVPYSSKEIVRVIKDPERDMTILLREKDSLKYGIITYGHIIEPGDFDSPVSDLPGFDIFETTEKKKIGNFNCTKISVKSATTIAEAWVTTEVGFKVSKYFPEFLKASGDVDLMNLRNALDQKGFVLSYWQTDLRSKEETTLEFNITEKELPDNLFKAGADFLVLDRDGMTQLMTDAQKDVQKKKQWDEFHQLFGNN